MPSVCLLFLFKDGNVSLGMQFRAKALFRKYQIQPLYWLIGNMLGDSVTSDKTAGYSCRLIYIDMTGPAEKLPKVID